ncbi:hypothetical protein DB32_008197 [Sandaracinus amylolyticus]|uniref:Uncharacterized protein n=1 Tax=Sandaracinus amylolyticus TaxID=927083 RepID=A0A0F6W9T8_9BACT|nr:hypothetical protein DB32_008197 [Sandaracinus amylolyticus]
MSAGPLARADGRDGLGPGRTHRTRNAPRESRRIQGLHRIRSRSRNADLRGVRLPAGALPA